MADTEDIYKLLAVNFFEKDWREAEVIKRLSLSVFTVSLSLFSGIWWGLL